MRATTIKAYRQVVHSVTNIQKLLFEHMAPKPILFLKYRPHQTRSDQCNIFNSNNHIFCALTFHLVPINTFIPVKNAQIIFIRNIRTKVAYQTIIKPDWLSLIDWTQSNGLIVVPSVFSRTYKNLARKATRIILPNTPISDDFSRADLIESFTKCTKCTCVGDLMTNSEWLIVKLAWSLQKVYFKKICYKVKSFGSPNCLQPKWRSENFHFWGCHWQCIDLLDILYWS